MIVIQGFTHSLSSSGDQNGSSSMLLEEPQQLFDSLWVSYKILGLKNVIYDVPSLSTLCVIREMDKIF